MSKNTKQGARHSRADQTKLQTVHDNAVALGAVCDMEDDAGDGKTLNELKARIRLRIPVNLQHKGITDAPNLRGNDQQTCSNCQFYKYLPSAEIYNPDGTTSYGPGRGICEKHNFGTQGNYVCDDWKQFEYEEMLASPEKSLVTFGGAVKALGGGKVGGYLVRFSDENNPDLEDEYFTKETDFGDALRYPTLYHHGLDLKIGRRRIGSVDVRLDEVGLWVEGQLEQRDEYEKAILKLAEAGKLGWSSGAAAHTVERVKTPKATHITQWYIAEASLTPTPAEPRNTVVSLKSLQAESEADPKAEPEGTLTNVPAQATVTTSNDAAIKHNLEASNEATEDIQMDEIKSVLEGIDALGKTIGTLAANVNTVTERVNAVETALKAEPPVGTKAAHIVVTEAAEDRPFRTLAEQLKAVKAFELSKGQNEHPRLKGLKAVTGAGEVVPTDGGLLLEPTLSAEFIAPLHEDGPFSAAVRTLPVSTNSNYGWINGIDETSRVAGSRWGGIRGYRLAEGDTLTASKPTFRRINWELKKFGVLVYGTDELLADAAMFSQVVQQGVREELVFMVNDDIMNGIGTAGPQGFMNSGALITVTRTTGSKILGEDISAMYNRMDLRGRANAVWYIGNDSSPQLDNLFAVGSTAVLYPYASIGADGVKRLYGRPVVTTEFNASLNTTGDIAFCDMSQYLFWEKSGIQEATSIHVQFLTDQTVFRFLYRCDGRSAVASALTPYKGSTTTSPFVVLGSAT